MKIDKIKIETILADQGKTKQNFLPFAVCPVKMSPQSSIGELANQKQPENWRRG